MTLALYLIAAWFAGALVGFAFGLHRGTRACQRNEDMRRAILARLEEARPR